MTTYSDLYPEDVVLLFTKWFLDPTPEFQYFVPLDKFVAYGIISALGCGGSGGQYPSGTGGGALVKSKVKLTPGELLLIQVGNTPTASTLGTSYVKRADNTVLVYADRGRGVGPGGLAINSTGDLKKDGHAESEAGDFRGGPASDFNITKSQGFGLYGFHKAVEGLSQATDPGGGGLTRPVYDGAGSYIRDIGEGGGAGRVCIEYYNGDPGPIDL